MSHPYFLLRFRLDGIVTVVDAVNGEATLQDYPEALKQVAVADRLVISKTDLLDSDEKRQGLQILSRRLHRINPTARLLTNEESIGVADLLNAGLHDPAGDGVNVRSWMNAEALDKICDVCGEAGDHAHHHHGHHDEAIRSFCLTRSEPLSPDACGMFLEMLRSAHGPHLLRVKGVIALSDV